MSRYGFALKILKQQLAKLVISPLSSMPIKISHFDEIPSDGTPPFSTFWDGNGRTLLSYLVNRIEMFEGKEDQISPLWTRRYVTAVMAFIKKQNCHILVYGNDRNGDNDALIPAIGNALNIPTVSELLNLFVGNINIY
jgi:hypothetical protein